MEPRDLMSAKSAAKRELGHIPGVEGFGIGAEALRVYVKNAGVRRELPDEFHGVPVECVVVGDITAASD